MRFGQICLKFLVVHTQGHEYTCQYSLTFTCSWDIKHSFDYRDLGNHGAFPLKPGKQNNIRNPVIFSLDTSPGSA